MNYEYSTNQTIDDINIKCATGWSVQSFLKVTGSTFDVMYGQGVPEVDKPMYMNLIESGSTEAQFYIDRSMSYGDVVFIVFLSIFTIAIICKWIGEFAFSRD